jgi:hypothetical protein
MPTKGEAIYVITYREANGDVKRYTARGVSQRDSARLVIQRSGGKVISVTKVGRR